MALTKDFKHTVMQRVQSDPGFRRALLTDSLNEFFSGDIDIAKSVLRDYVNATISFTKLAEAVNGNSKSLQRMLGPNGNPTIQAFSAIIKVLAAHEGITLEVIAT